MNVVRLALFFVGVFFLISSCSHQATLSAENSQSFQDYKSGFYKLVVNDLKKNKVASAPDLKISRITETDAELRIQYELKFHESYSDGERIDRLTVGTAILKKKKDNNVWVLEEISDAKQSLVFNQGIKVGS